MPIDKRRSIFELFALLRLLNYLIFFQVRCEKGIPEKDWAEKRGAMADEIEDLEEGYHRDALRDGWVKYLSTAYPPGSKRLSLDLRTVQTKVVVEGDDI